MLYVATYRMAEAWHQRKHGWLLDLYILATSKVISGQVLTCDGAHHWLQTNQSKTDSRWWMWAYLCDESILVLPSLTVGVDKVLHLTQMVLFRLLEAVARLGHALLEVIPHIRVLLHKDSILIDCGGKQEGLNFRLPTMVMCCTF